MERLSITRLVVRALCLLTILPAAVMLYLFRDHLEGKAVLLILVGVVIVLGAALLWGVVRSIGAIHRSLTGVAAGEGDALGLQRGPVELREMAEIISALNRLTVEFRENAAQLETFIQRFATLAEITEVTGKVPNVQDLLDLVLRKAMNATHARRGSIVLRPDHGDGLELAATHGWPKDNGPPPGRPTVTDRVIQSGEPLLVEDVEPALGRPNDAERYVRESFLIMPLKTKSGTIGAVCLSEKDTGGAFNTQDQQFLSVLLGQVGYAVENARLLGQAREAAQALRSTVENQEEQIRQARRQIAEADKLAALGQLAGGVAHDFNNILQAILGYVEFGQRGLTPGESRHRDLSHIKEAAERAAELTGQLLAFGGRQMLQPIHIDLNRVVEDLMKMLDRVIGEHIERELRLAPNIGAVRADPRQVERVIMNLCLNARDAIVGSGKITIATSEAVLDERFCQSKPWARPGSYVRLIVADDGCGMDQDTMRQIFEPFFTTKGEGRGTGLGLATVYGIVKQHGGLIDVASSPGKGTEFRIYLPAVAAGAVETAAPDQKSAPRGGSETVLVAEDEKHVREVACRTLENAGYTVLVAADGEEACRILDEPGRRIDVAVLDAVMPRLGGLELCRRIRAKDADFPIVLCSGYSTEIVEFTLVNAPDVRFLPKPAHGDDLLRAVRDALDAHRSAVQS